MSSVQCWAQKTRPTRVRKSSLTQQEPPGENTESSRSKFTHTHLCSRCKCRCLLSSPKQSHKLSFRESENHPKDVRRTEKCCRAPAASRPHQSSALGLQGGNKCSNSSYSVQCEMATRLGEWSNSNARAWLRQVPALSLNCWKVEMVSFKCQFSYL